GSHLCHAWPESEHTRSGVEGSIGHQRQRRDVEVDRSPGGIAGADRKNKRLTEIDRLVSDRVENDASINRRSCLVDARSIEGISDGKCNRVDSRRRVAVSRACAAAAAAVAEI